MEAFWTWLKRWWWALALGVVTLAGAFLLGRYAGRGFWNGLGERIAVKLADSEAAHDISVAKVKATGEAERAKLAEVLSKPDDIERRKAVAELLKDL